MNMIAQLSRNIANLHKADYYLDRIKNLHWDDPYVAKTALFVRNNFDLFEQKWRDGLQNTFFVFCITRLVVLGGPPVFQRNLRDSDATTQANFENGCTQLRRDITDLLGRMRDQRSVLFSQQNMASIDAAFHQFDKLSFLVFKIGQDGEKSGSGMGEDLQQWDASLQKCVNDFGLDGRFNPVFPDSNKPLADRVRSREETISYFVEALANNPQQNAKRQFDSRDKGNSFERWKDKLLSNRWAAGLTFIVVVLTAVFALANGGLDLVLKGLELKSKSEQSNSQDPTPTLRLVYPSFPALIFQNRSKKVVKNIKWACGIWNVCLPNHVDPLPIRIQIFDFIRAGQDGGPQNLLNPEALSLVKPGDQLVGSIAFTCPDCDSERVYVISIVWGKGGWYSELPQQKQGGLITPKLVTADGLKAFANDLERMVPSEKRVPISDR